MGVSIGTSYTSLHALTVSASARLATAAAVRAVIDFLEELVILANELVVGLELERALVALRAFSNWPSCSSAIARLLNAAG